MNELDSVASFDFGGLNPCNEHLYDLYCSGNIEEEDRPALIKEVTCNPAPKPGLNLTAYK